MNKRIRDLTEQAAGNFTENFKWDYLPEIDKDIFEKFAQLIVEECAKICVEQNVSNLSLDVIHKSGKFTVQELATKSCGENLAKQIKEHFGVE